MFCGLLVFLGTGFAIRAPRHVSAFAKMSMDQITQALVNSNVALFRKNTNTTSSDIELASLDRNDRYSVLPSITDTVNTNSDYLDSIWNWARGVGQTGHKMLSYPLHTSVYLNIYAYNGRLTDPSDSYDTNVAGDIVMGGSTWEIWPDGTRVEFYFDFASDIPSSGCIRSSFLEAAARFTEATGDCIAFVETNVKLPTSLLVTTSDMQGCFSSLGYQGTSNNVLNLGIGCRNVGTIMHLMGHVLGMAHENQRPDAMDHIKVNIDSIDVLGMSSSSMIDPILTTKYAFVFKPLSGTNTKWETISLKYPYEYGSLMHNSKSAYSVDVATELTITGKISTQFDDLMGNRGYLTER